MTRFFFLLAFCFLHISFAQQGPGEYMSELAENYKQINKDTWDYIRQASRGRNASKVEKRRSELATTLKQAKYEASKKPGYQGDKSLRDAYASYLGLTYLSVNDEYRKIVDLERIAEESYDAMEAYLLTKERVNQKMDSAYQQLKKAQNDFAATYNVNLVEGSSRISKKLSNASVINAYDNSIFLIFFKSNFYEGEMINAQNEGKVGDMEQFRQTLEIVSQEGMEELKKVDSYEGDNSLKEACFSMLEFYYGEAVRYAPKQIDFYQKSDKMQTASKIFQSKKQKDLTQAEINDYNNSVNEYNTAVKTFNETNEYLNKFRTKRLNNFNQTRQNFFNKYL